MEDNDISAKILDEIVSRIKMEKLIPKGATKLQDEIYIEVETIQGA